MHRSFVWESFSVIREFAMCVQYALASKLTKAICSCSVGWLLSLSPPLRLLLSYSGDCNCRQPLYARLACKRRCRQIKDAIRTAAAWTVRSFGSTQPPNLLPVTDPCVMDVMATSSSPPFGPPRRRVPSRSVPAGGRTCAAAEIPLRLPQAEARLRLCLPHLPFASSQQSLHAERQDSNIYALTLVPASSCMMEENRNRMSNNQ